jgi:hypothetical protein
VGAAVERIVDANDGAAVGAAVGICVGIDTGTLVGADVLTGALEADGCQTLLIVGLMWIAKQHTHRPAPHKSAHPGSGPKNKN